MNMLSQISDQFKDRLKSPLVLFFLLGWLHTNYDLILYITSLELGADTKINFIKKYNMLSTTNMFWYPLGTALFLYFSWYFLDALSKGLMEKHSDLVRVVSSRVESFIHTIDIPTNKVKRMENIVNELTSNHSSEKIRADDLQRQITKIIEGIIFNTPTGYELSAYESNTIHKSDHRYLIVKSKERMDDYRFREFNLKLQKFQAGAISQYSGDNNLIAIDVSGIVNAPAKGVIAEIKYFGLEIISGVDTLALPKTR